MCLLSCGDSHICVYVHCSASVQTRCLCLFYVHDVYLIVRAVCQCWQHCDGYHIGENFYLVQIFIACRLSRIIEQAHVDWQIKTCHFTSPLLPTFPTKALWWFSRWCSSSTNQACQRGSKKEQSAIQKDSHCKILPEKQAALAWYARGNGNKAAARFFCSMPDYFDSVAHWVPCLIPCCLDEKGMASYSKREQK